MDEMGGVKDAERERPSWQEYASLGHSSPSIALADVGLDRDKTLRQVLHDYFEQLGYLLDVTADDDSYRRSALKALAHPSLVLGRAWSATPKGSTLASRSVPPNRRTGAPSQ